MVFGLEDTIVSLREGAQCAHIGDKVRHYCVNHKVFFVFFIKLMCFSFDNDEITTTDTNYYNYGLCLDY